MKDKEGEYRAQKTPNPNLGHLLRNQEYIGNMVAFFKGSGRYSELWCSAIQMEYYVSLFY